MTDSPRLAAFRTRCRAALVRSPHVAAALDGWRAEGGALALVGPSGAGRTHLIDHAARALTRADAAWLRLQAWPGRAWHAVEVALRDPALAGPAVALPDHADPARRCQAVAAALVQRAGGPLWVLADDLHHLDPRSAAALAVLAATEGVSVLVAGEAAPDWATRAIPLPTWTPEEATPALAEVLGHPVTPTQVEALLQAAGGWPGRLLRRVEVAVAQDAFDPDAGALREGPGAASLLPAALSTPPTGAARAVGAALAFAPEPLPVGELARLCGLSEAAAGAGLQQLVDPGLVRVEGDRAAPSDPRARGRLTPTAAPAALHLALLDRLSQQRAPVAWLVPPLVHAGDASRIQRHGRAALRALADRDPEAAAAAGPRMWRHGGDAALAAVAVPAIGAAGRAGEALSFAERALAARPGDASEARARLYAALARLQAERLGDASAARTAVREARRALAGTPPPLSLLAAEADLLLRARQVGPALQTARQGTRRPLPTDPDDRAAWLALRRAEGRALAAADRLDAATLCLRDLPEATTPTEREPLLVEAGSLNWRAGQFRAAADAYAAAARADRTTVGTDQVRWMDRAATARYHGGDRSAAAETWHRALALARRAGAALEQVRVQATLCSVLRELCRYDTAARHGHEAFEVATAAGATRDALHAGLAMADLRLATRDLDDAAAWLTRCNRLVERQPQPRARGRLARRWAELAVRRRDAQADEAVAEALRAAQRAELTRDAARALALKAVVLARAGRHEQLAATIKRATAPLIEQGAARTLAEVRLWAAQALLEAGQPGAAIEQAAHVVVWADEVGHQLFRNLGDDLTARARVQEEQEEPTAEAADLERLLEVGVALGRERRLEALLDQIARAAMHLVEADRAFVILLGDPDDAGPRVVASASRSDADPGQPSSSVVQTALSRGREVIVSNVEERGDLRAQDSIVHLRLRSAWCIPLVEGDRTLGAIYADSRIVTQGELSRATRLLRALAGQAAVAVTNARLLAETTRRAERAADIAHDIRSPLSSVAMAAQQLQALDELEEWVVETLGLVESQVRGVMGMAHRFLEDRPGRPHAFELGQRVERLASIAARDARHLGRTVTFEAGSAAVVHGEPEELDRAVTNLLANALQHTPEGTTVEVRVDVHDAHARVTVRDHGAGIAPEVLPTLFDRGVRSSTTGGFGLGLAIARRIVEDAGGVLVADNHPDGGARFQARLPLRAPAAATDSLA